MLIHHLAMTNPQFCFRDTVFDGPSLLLDRRETVRRVTVKAQLQQLRDTGRYTCFKLGWHPVYDKKDLWPVPRSLFWDSDIAKWIEGACYFLAQQFDAEIDAAVQELVADIRSAQQADGYLNVYFTVVEPEARWSNIRDQHELYNAGHLIEAALAHHDLYHNDLLLGPIEKYVQLLAHVFGPGPDQRHAYPGHPEIELALLRLYKATGSATAYDLARYFLEERGNPTGQAGMLYYDWEAQQRGDVRWKRPDAYPMAGSPWYNQAHAPIRQQTSVEGHAVRVMYLLTGVADLVCLDAGDRPLADRAAWWAALQRLWTNMVDCKMSVTGGIGAMTQWEGFGIDFFLPQGTDEGGCYNETCASIAVLMLAERLLEVDLDARYADVAELCLYNTVLTAMDLGGTAFTYVNQLASSPQDKSERFDWFECACCPPNLMRLFGSLGGYLWDYGRDKDTAGGGVFIHVHLYTSATLTFAAGDQDTSVVRLTQKSNWPWQGKVEFSLQRPPAVQTTIQLRIPAWSRGKFTMNPPLSTARIIKGYLLLPPDYTAQHDHFTLTVGGFAPRFVSPHPYTNQNTLTLCRGPLVYCVEDADNSWVDDHFKNTVVSSRCAVTEERKTISGTDHAYIGLKAAGQQRDMTYFRCQTTEGSDPGIAVVPDTTHMLGPPHQLVFVPYYLRANRGGKGHMRVGLLRKD